MDGLERDLEQQAQVMRLNVMDDVGGELAIRYMIRGVPTLLVLDGDGRVVKYFEGSRLDRTAIQETVEGLSQP